MKNHLILFQVLLMLICVGLSHGCDDCHNGAEANGNAAHGHLRSVGRNSIRDNASGSKISTVDIAEDDADGHNHKRKLRKRKTRVHAKVSLK